MRKLASIQRIKKLHNLPQFDNLVLAEVLGWKTLVNKKDFQEGDLCVYFEIDSILPEKLEFEFLRKYKFKIKTQKLKGVLSQGLCMPISLLDKFSVDIDTISSHLREGFDVTELLNVIKYEEPQAIGGEIAGQFPMFLIPKTDQRRIQENPDLIKKYLPKNEWVISEKIDGCSATYLMYVKDPQSKNINREDVEFVVCSRNIMLHKGSGVHWHIAEKYNIENLLWKQLMYRGADTIAVQGEIIGEKIQGNPYKLKTQDLYVYDIFVNGKYLDWNLFEKSTEEMNLKTVPIINNVYNFNDFVEDEIVIFENGNTENFALNIDKLMFYSTAKSKINENVWREGLVIRTRLEKFDINWGRLSFKVISPEYLLKKGK